MKEAYTEIIRTRHPIFEVPLSPANLETVYHVRFLPRIRTSAAVRADITV
jgi:hypothetical protein